MKVHYKKQLQDVCAKEASFDIEDGCIKNLQFENGCKGNLRAIGLLIEDMPVEKVIDVLAGNPCGSRATSCTDQLAKILAEIQAENAIS